MERPDLPVGLPADIEQKKMKARLWFEALRERICATFEQIEQELTGPQSSWSPGHFEKAPWERDEGKGAVAVHASIVARSRSGGKRSRIQSGPNGRRS